jgi:hypothetical protein
LRSYASSFAGRPSIIVLVGFFIVVRKVVVAFLAFFVCPV